MYWQTTAQSLPGRKIITQPSGAATVPIKQPAQVPVRGGTFPAKDYSQTGAPNKTTTANTAITGLYSNASIVDGIKVRKTFRLHNPVAGTRNINGTTRNKGEGTMGKVKVYGKERELGRDADGSDCNLETRQITLNDQGYLTLDLASQITKVLPGTAFHFNDFIDGSWKTITDNRNPFKISCSNPNINGLVSENVPATATQSDIRQAVSNIYGRFPTDPAKVASLTFSMYAQEVCNNADLSVRIGASGYGFGFSADNFFSYSTKSNKRTFFVDIVKTLYTIDAEENNKGLFTNSTMDANDVVYIASVTYGIRVLASIELDIKDETILNDFNAKYKGLLYGGDFSAEVFAQDTRNQATVKFFVVAGTNASVTPAYNIAEMKQRLEELTKTINYHTCHPIRYTLKNNNNELVTYASATDYFKYRSCDPPGENRKPATVKVRISGIELDDMEKDDVDLYGAVWANVVKADHSNLTPRENIYHLLSLPANLHLQSEDIKKGNYRMGYGRTVEFNFQADEAAGAVLYIYFDLTDEDDSPDDPIEMPNLSKFPLKTRDGSTRYYYGLKIYLDEIKKVEQAGTDIKVNCVDNEGDYPFTISVNIQKL